MSAAWSYAPEVLGRVWIDESSGAGAVTWVLSRPASLPKRSAVSSADAELLQTTVDVTRPDGGRSGCVETFLGTRPGRSLSGMGVGGCTRFHGARVGRRCMTFHDYLALR